MAAAVAAPVIMTAVAGMLTAISKLITAGADQQLQEEALYEAEEHMKRALDHFKFGAPPA